MARVTPLFFVSYFLNAMFEKYAPDDRCTAFEDSVEQAIERDSGWMIVPEDDAEVVV